jgi:hypothetical protein
MPLKLKVAFDEKNMSRPSFWRNIVLSRKSNPCGKVIHHNTETVSYTLWWNTAKLCFKFIRNYLVWNMILIFLLLLRKTYCFLCPVRPSVRHKIWPRMPLKLKVAFDEKNMSRPSFWRNIVFQRREITHSKMVWLKCHYDMQYSIQK